MTKATTTHNKRTTHQTFKKMSTLMTNQTVNKHQVIQDQVQTYNSNNLTQNGSLARPKTSLKP